MNRWLRLLIKRWNFCHYDLTSVISLLIFRVELFLIIFWIQTLVFRGLFEHFYRSHGWLFNFLIGDFLVGVYNVIVLRLHKFDLLFLCSIVIALRILVRHCSTLILVTKCFIFNSLFDGFQLIIFRIESFSWILRHILKNNTSSLIWILWTIKRWLIQLIQHENNLCIRLLLTHTLWIILGNNSFIYQIFKLYKRLSQRR